MKTWQKILIGAGIVAGGVLAYKKFGKKSSPYEGMLVKGTGDEIYLVQNGKKRHVPTLEVLNSLKAQGAPSMMLDNNTLFSIPTGESL